MPPYHSDATIPWRPLTDLCPDCKPALTHSHEPITIMKTLFRSLPRWNANAGVFLDIGLAFDAKETALALELGFRVIGIEAHHDYYATVLARHRGNVTNGRLTLLHAAVSNSTGWQSFYRSGEASSLSNSSATMKLSMVDRDHKSEVVRLTTIDDVIGGDDCAALKLDIQGYEYEALLGATRLLSRPIASAPLVMLEVYEAMRNDQRNLPHLRLLMGYGYTCYDVTSAPRHAFQSDLSLRHRSRCCKVRSNPWNIMACPKLYDDPTRINCAMPVFTDFVCVKHARTKGNG